MTNSISETARRYLLGELPEPEALALEVRFLEDDGLFQEVTHVENDLIDAYVREELTESEKQRFVNGYLTTPERRMNVEFARLLLDNLAESSNTPVPPAEKPAPAWVPPRAVAIPFRTAYLFSAFILIVMCGLVWALSSNVRLRREIHGIQAQLAKLEQQLHQLVEQHSVPDRGSAGQQDRPENVRPPGPDIVVLNLTPGSPRGYGPTKEMRIPASAVLIQLRLYLEQDTHPVYSASLRGADTRQIWKKNGLTGHDDRHGSKILVLGIPATIIASGDFMVVVNGIGLDGASEEVAQYRFSAARD